MPSLPLSSTDLNFSLIVLVSWPFPGASGRVLPSDHMYSIQFSSLAVADLFFLPSFPLLHSFLTSYFCFVSLISLLTLFSIFLCIYSHIYIFILLLKNTYPPVAVILLQVTYAIRCCCFSIVALLLRDPEFGQWACIPQGLSDSLDGHFSWKSKRPGFSSRPAGWAPRRRRKRLRTLSQSTSLLHLPTHNSSTGKICCPGAHLNLLDKMAVGGRSFLRSNVISSGSWRGQCTAWVPRKLHEWAPAFSSSSRPSKASACLDQTQGNTMLGSCFQHSSGTDEIVPGLSRGRREQRAKLASHPASFSLRVPGFLPRLQPLPLHRRVVCSSGHLCPPQELLEVRFSVVFIVVVAVVINISDSCLLWFLHGWFWEAESAAHPILSYRYPWVFLKDYFVP